MGKEELVNMDFINETDYFDQHFLVDKKIIDQFVNIANINDQDVIVEIGPGKGNITQLIASKCKYLYCIELDERLRPFLQSLCQKYNNMEVIYGSALSVCMPKCNKIITSPPYSIIEPFKHKVLKCYFQELYMIIGNHFALNVETRSVTKLGLFTNCFFHFERIMDIKPDSFFPAPRVKSSMIKLMIKKEEEIEDDVLLFFRYLFGLDHKKIKNALVESFILLAQSCVKHDD